MRISRLKSVKVPKPTVSRLGAYSRYLENLKRQEVAVVSSSEIAKAVGVSATQVRKDLAYFGDAGTKGVGYNVRHLSSYILKALGLDRKWPLVLVGAGNLGYALASYQGFNNRGFGVVGIFDNDPAKIGRKIAHLEVYPLEKFPEIVRTFRVRIGIIAVPERAAQEVADVMIANGVRAILNFASVPIDVPEHIVLPDVDLTSKLEAVTFHFAVRNAAVIERSLANARRF